MLHHFLLLLSSHKVICPGLHKFNHPDDPATILYETTWLTDGSFLFASLEPRIRLLTKRSDPTTTKEMCKRVSRLLAGWINYFLFAAMKARMRELWQWVKGRIRVIIYKKWKEPRKREEALLKCLALRKRKGDLDGWTEWRIQQKARDAKALGGYGDHYAKAGRNAKLAFFLTDWILETGHLLNPVAYYLKRRNSTC